jgi:hypothetical protein
MKKCSETCVAKQEKCDQNNCRFWIDYEDDLNCSLISIHKEGKMTLKEVGSRLGISYVRVKQIQDEAVSKIEKGLKDCY